MIAGVTYVLVGALLAWVGWRSWRYRNQEAISLIEATILKVTGEEPLPRTNLDRSLAVAQAILGFVLGPFFFLIGIIVISGELGLL